VKTLITRHECDPGVWFELWEEDGKVWRSYTDTLQHQRMDWRAECRKENQRIRRDAEALYGVGYLAPHERVELGWKYPELQAVDPKERADAWERFWKSSRSDPYRTVDKI